MKKAYLEQKSIPKFCSCVYNQNTLLLKDKWYHKLHESTSLMHQFWFNLMNKKRISKKKPFYIKIENANTRKWWKQNS